MAAHTSGNVYEESADRLKELFKHTASNRGQTLPTQSNKEKEILIKTHERQCKLLSDGHVPTKSFILPLPYPPSRFAIPNSQYQKLLLKDLLVDERNPQTFIILRTVTDPYIHSATVTLAEDETRQLARLTIWNQEDSLIEPIFPKGTIVAVKQPCWTRLLDGGYHVRVDHPSDIGILDRDSELIPEKQSWKTIPSQEDMDEGKDWKKEGDTMFLQKRFRRALVW